MEDKLEAIAIWKATDGELTNINNISCHWWDIKGIDFLFFSMGNGQYHDKERRAQFFILMRKWQAKQSASYKRTIPTASGENSYSQIDHSTASLNCYFF